MIESISSNRSVRIEQTDKNQWIHLEIDNLKSEGVIRQWESAGTVPSFDLGVLETQRKKLEKNPAHPPFRFVDTETEKEIRDSLFQWIVLTLLSGFFACITVMGLMSWLLVGKMPFDGPTDVILYAVIIGMFVVCLPFCFIRIKQLNECRKLNGGSEWLDDYARSETMKFKVGNKDNGDSERTHVFPIENMLFPTEYAVELYDVAARLKNAEKILDKAKKLRNEYSDHDMRDLLEAKIQETQNDYEIFGMEYEQVILCINDWFKAQEAEQIDNKIINLLLAES